MPFPLKKFLARYGIYLILLLGFALRLALIFIAPDVHIIGDQADYVRLAHEFSNPLTYHDTYRPPAYPAFLAVSLALFSESPAVIGIVQALLATVTGALFYTLTLGLFSKHSVALLAALYFAVYLELVAVTRMYYAETLFLLLLLSAFYLFLRGTRFDSRALLFGSGVLFAAAALTRELAGYFVLLVVPLWLLIVSAPQWKRGLISILVLYAGILLLLAPWVFRNWSLESRLLLVNRAGEFNFAKDNARLETALGLNTSPPDAVTSLFRGKRVIDYPQQINRELDALPPAQRSSYAFQRGVTIIAQAPLGWLLLKAQQLAALWKPPALDANYLQLEMLPHLWSDWLNAVTVFLLSILLLAAPIGFFFAPRSNHAAKLLLLLFILYSLGIFLLTHYQDRYRLPLLVIALPYAAYGIVVLMDALRARFSARAVFNVRTIGAAFVCFLFVILMWR
ncbi:MAG TPA: glycosyltransferase family 39 protein [Anaerolineae bacterium]|nr:glycosyltransferase family 39 protein [Anaerolineae bacterium]